MYSLKNESKAVKITLAVCCTLFLIICIYSILKYGNATLLGSLDQPNNDDVKYIRSAWILAETGNYVYHRPPEPTVFMMPGLPYTLSLFTIIFGKFGGLTAFRIMQALLQAASLILVFLIGRKAFNSKVGILAVVLNTVYFVDIWVSNLILTETFFKFFVLNLVYFSMFALEEKKLKFYILGALAWGLATLFRPTIATYPIVMLIMWILRKYSWKDILKYTLVSLAVFCLVLSPWWIRNYQIFHRFIPLTLATGNPMLQGTYINYDQSSRATDGLDYSQFKYPADSEIANNEVEMAISKYRLKNLVPKQPLQFLLWYTFGKALYQVKGAFYWIPILGVNGNLINVLHHIILVIALIGSIIYLRRKEGNRLGTLVFATIIYFIVAYLPFYAFSRYFYPAMPFVFIFAAFLLQLLYHKIRKGSGLGGELN